MDSSAETPPEGEAAAMSATETAAMRPRGRQFFANPGPTNIPDSVLQAVATVPMNWGCLPVVTGTTTTM